MKLLDKIICWFGGHHIDFIERNMLRFKNEALNREDFIGHYTTCWCGKKKMEIEEDGIKTKKN